MMRPPTCSVTRRRSGEWPLSAPTLLWLSVFFVVPTAVVLAMAFKPADSFGGTGQGWTLATVAGLADASYARIAWRTLWISVVSTAGCLALGLPTGCYLARVGRQWRPWLLLLVVVPFWTSFLIRVFAWKTLLHPEGVLKRALVLLHLVAPADTLMYCPQIVCMVTVYSYLPFAILPIYAAAERFDDSLIEAARDLGATRLQALRLVFLPGIRRGLVAATLVVLVPSLGSYVIPDIVGGPSSEMLGNKIAQRTFVDRNLPHASALSAVLVLVVLVPLLAWVLAQRRWRRQESPRENGGRGTAVLAGVGRE